VASTSKLAPYYIATIQLPVHRSYEVRILLTTYTTYVVGWIEAFELPVRPGASPSTCSGYDQNTEYSILVVGAVEGSRIQNAQIGFHPHSKSLLQALTRELWSREGKQTTACCPRKNQGLMTIGSATLGLRYFAGAIRGAKQLKRGRPSSSTDRRPDELTLLYCRWDVRELPACSWQRPVSSLPDTRDLSSSVQPAQVYNIMETTPKVTGEFLLFCVWRRLCKPQAESPCAHHEPNGK
jgi:hypothetical protein